MEKSPDAFRTISEVSEWLETPAHVLRFWESRFSQVKPVKRAGGRRYYRPSDMLLLGGIKKLLHEDGMTIRGVQKILRENGVKYVAGLSQPLEGEEDTSFDVVPADLPPPESPSAEDEAPMAENAEPPVEEDNVVRLSPRNGAGEEAGAQMSLFEPEEVAEAEDVGEAVGDPDDQPNTVEPSEIEAAPAPDDAENTPEPEPETGDAPPARSIPALDLPAEPDLDALPPADTPMAARLRMPEAQTSLAAADPETLAALVQRLRAVAARFDAADG